MSLNKFMHPRNRYKNKKPSFLELALKYPEFRKQVTQDETGKVFLDFKNADALRALTTCLLNEDFGLNVHLPTDRLVPTLPLRLNYIHWIEDIVGKEQGKWGIDIGTGASCIYPLLAAKVQKWNFLASESDPENFYHAKKNVVANKLQDFIHVEQVSVEDALSGPVESFKLADKFDFCMCNPPFFADHMEAQAISTSRSVDRPEAQTLSTASPQECIAKGGEVGFVRQMIEESVLLRNKIKVYSSMVGKKSSLAQLKEDLRIHMVPKFSTTEFCQGKTMRWGIAWSFDESIEFPKSAFECRKEKPPLQYSVPEGSGGVDYKVHTIAAFLKEVFAAMKIHCYQGKTAKSFTSITLTATENTWCHQRRKRRQQKRQQEDDKQLNIEDNETKDKGPSDEVNDNTMRKSIIQLSEEMEDKKDTDNNGDCGILKDTSKCPLQSESKKRMHSEENLEINQSPAKIIKFDKAAKVENGLSLDTRSGKSEESTDLKSISGNDSLNISPMSDVEKSSPSKEVVKDESLMSNPTEESEESPKDYIVKCVLRLKRTRDKIMMELEWLDGTSRELMHQIKTFLVNKLAENRICS